MGMICRYAERFKASSLTFIHFIKVECPTGSGDYMNLANVAEEIQHRIIHIFSRDVDGQRATNGDNPKWDHDPHFRDYLQFYEVRIRTRISLNRRAELAFDAVLPCR